MRAYATIEDLAAYAHPGLLDGLEPVRLEAMLQRASDEVAAGPRRGVEVSEAEKQRVLETAIRELLLLRRCP